MPLTTLVAGPEFAPVRRELTAWVEARLAEAAHPGRGRRLKGLSALFARQLKKLPARDRRRLGERYRPSTSAPPSLADRLSALSDLRPAAPLEGPLTVDIPATLLAPSLPRISYEVSAVRCEHSTRELSADELYMTLFTGGPVGVPEMLGPRKLGDFRNGDAVSFSPPIATSPLALDAVDGFQSFLAVAYCAEVDRDEYFQLMPAIYEDLLADGTIPIVTQQSGERAIIATLLVGQLVALATGLVVTIANPAVGIAILVGTIAAIVGELTLLWTTDEMFTVQVDVLEVPVDVEHPPAAQVSPAHTWPLHGYGADYTVTTRWRIA